MTFRTAWVTTLALVALAGSAVIAAEWGACDRSDVRAAHYCEKDDALLYSTELRSHVIFWQCPGCDARERLGGQCASCGNERERKVSDRDVCGLCLEKPTAAEACVRRAYDCRECGSHALERSVCRECEEVRRGHDVRALVTYSCRACGESSLTAGTCAQPACEAHGKALDRSCSMSGEFPHVTPVRRSPE